MKVPAVTVTTVEYKIVEITLDDILSQARINSAAWGLKEVSVGQTAAGKDALKIELAKK
jgi:hypothetical protein